MKFRISAIAAAVAAATLSAAAGAAAVDFHGYARSGVGASDKGGSMVCYKNVGSMGSYRLGNECDTYMELAFDANLAEKSGSAFKLHTMVAAGTQQLTDWEQSTPAWRQVWAEATNIGAGALSNSSLWAGKRYYKRQDIHMLDYFYNEVTGPGAGIESIDVGGFAKFSYAYMRQTDTDWSTTDIGSYHPDVGSDGAKSITNHDLRLEGIAIGDEFGTVDVMFNYAGKNNRNDVKGKDGYAFTAQHTLNVLGGFNRVHMTYASDASTLSHGVKTWTDDTYNYTGFQVMDHLVFDFGAVNGSAVIGYQTEKGPSWYNGTTRKEFTIGVRPWYHFNDLYSIGGELGYINVDPENNGDKQTLTKATIAAQISAGKSYWARPAIRAYYTYAKWNDALKGSNVTCTGRDCGVNVSSSGFADATSGGTYGVQFEAWW
ncbi:carbohydrate porin [Niveibacterium sp. SC-1]|uniref:maltoporin n=1 Tax=Niveibacterium sp. SC-1 TaxID=3135646 RepID=UPI00311FE0F9